MKELFEYSILALVAGVLLNFVPCVLPVIPLKVRAVLREIKGELIEKKGFSVVAPIRIKTPSSTSSSNTSCWVRLKR